MLRDTANESRYDVGLQVSSQCSFFCHPSAQTLGSRKIDCKRANIFDKITKKLDPSVKHWDDRGGRLLG
ncbi:hypothetical protein [Wolbachia endosymbiont of Aedes albopictus]|uniref:hypothetical protein n=1 Tax=Wolbachia endosymbiont of Aedes albopictus TaxID=167957 RepID=UPI00397D735B